MITKEWRRYLGPHQNDPTFRRARADTYGTWARWLWCFLQALSPRLNPFQDTGIRFRVMTRSEKQPVLQSVQLGPYTLPNRLAMAPLTRMRASEGNLANPLIAEYYAQRASAGLIVSEATPVSPRGHGYHLTPGIHNQAQAEAWKQVTGKVHQAGGRIFLQLWHVGRQSHQDLQPGGELPVAPSAISAGEYAVTAEGPKPHPVPRALDIAEIPAIIEEFRQGARYALEASFDGVEIHGANGYLPDQFLEDGSNHRADEYGGSIPNRARFLLEVTKAAIEVWGASRVGVRLSPGGTFGGMKDSTPWETFSYVVRELNKLGLAYIHLVEPRDGQTGLSASRFRPLITGKTRLISAGGYTRETANDAIEAGHADLIAFGRLFIANPDLPRRVELEADLNPYDRGTFYGGDARGYVDYPALPVGEIALAGVTTA